MRGAEFWAGVLAALNLLSIGAFVKSAILFGDLPGQWQLCAYTLRGIDPFPLVGLEIPLIDELGAIPYGWGTAPWGLILGNFFYAGFLPLAAAKIYFIALNLVLLSTTTFLFYRSKKKSTTLIVFGCSASFSIAMLTGNAGGAICALLLICTLTAERRPLLTGVLLSFAMVKPQVALAFCLLFLIERRFKILLTAASIDLGAWLIAALLVERTPLRLLEEFLSANVGGDTQFSGVFALLIANPMQATLASMIFGAAFILWFRSPSAACLATSFWSYSFFSEFYLLSLPALECFRSNKKFLGALLHVGFVTWASLAFWYQLKLRCGLIEPGGLIEQTFLLECGLGVRMLFCPWLIAAGFWLNQSPPSPSPPSSSSSSRS